MAWCTECDEHGMVPLVIVRAAGEVVAVNRVPCPKCQGTKVWYCCDGHDGNEETATPARD